MDAITESDTPRCKGSRARAGSTHCLLCVLVIDVLLVILPMVSLAVSTTYYVDASSGSDANRGTKPAAPWRSLSRVNVFPFAPGDVIAFRRGQTWTGHLSVSRSGNAGRPITYTAYGIGPKPVLRNPRDTGEGCAISVRGHWIVLEGLAVDSTTLGGIRIEKKAEHNIIRNCEISAVGIGVMLSGMRNLVTGNFIHHLRMVVNDEAPDNDFGAIGVGLFEGFNEVAYNRFDSCFARSHDYGEDGGAMEVYADAVLIDSLFLHHNWINDANVCVEIGGVNNGGCRNLRLSYNVFVNRRGGMFAFIHAAGLFGLAMSDCRFENNTVVCGGFRTAAAPLIGWNGVMTETALSVRNNIFYLDGGGTIKVRSHQGRFTHSHNVYFRTDGSARFVGFPLGEGEVTANPDFVDVRQNDFRLQIGSPALNRGINLGYTQDFLGTPIPANSLPDIGSFQCSGGVVPHVR